MWASYSGLEEFAGKSNSSPSSGVGIIAQYALHIWDSQEESRLDRIESKHSHIYNRRLFINVGLVILTRVLYLNVSTYHLASTTDKGVTQIADRSLPHLLPTITHYRFMTLRIPARRELSHDIQNSGLCPWGTVALMRQTIWGKMGSWDGELEGEEVSEYHAGTDILERFSTLERLWAPGLRFGQTSQEGLYCRWVNDIFQRHGRYKRS